MTTAVAVKNDPHVTLVEPVAPDLVRVRAWFGEHVIADWTGDPATAKLIARSWSRRFGLTPTVEPVVARS